MTTVRWLPITRRRARLTGTAQRLGAKPITPFPVTAPANSAAWVATQQSTDEPKLNMGHSHRLPVMTSRRYRTRPDKHKAHDPHAELTSSSTLQPADTSGKTEKQAAQQPSRLAIASYSTKNNLQCQTRKMTSCPTPGRAAAH